MKLADLIALAIIMSCMLLLFFYRPKTKSDTFKCEAWIEGKGKLFEVNLFPEDDHFDSSERKIFAPYRVKLTRLKP